MRYVFAYGAIAGAIAIRIISATPSLVALISAALLRDPRVLPAR